jgi:hypothetical protein
MQALGDEMTATGRPIDDEELVYIITRLDIDFSPINLILPPKTPDPPPMSLSR